MRSGRDDGRRPTTVRVRVVHHPLGRWVVLPPDARSGIPCETLEDARRIAHLSVRDGDACELVVRDAYHRVLERGLIHGAGATAATSPPHPATRSSDAAAERARPHG